MEPLEIHRRLQSFMRITIDGSPRESIFNGQLPSGFAVVAPKDRRVCKSLKH